MQGELKVIFPNPSVCWSVRNCLMTSIESRRMAGWRDNHCEVSPLWCGAATTFLCTVSYPNAKWTLGELNNTHCQLSWKLSLICLQIHDFSIVYLLNLNDTPFRHIRAMDPAVSQRNSTQITMSKSVTLIILFMSPGIQLHTNQSWRITLRCRPPFCWLISSMQLKTGTEPKGSPSLLTNPIYSHQAY